MAPTGQVPSPVLPELLVPKTVDHGAQETRDDVDDQEEDVTNLQTEAREERDESGLKGGNHKGKHAQQQLEQKERVSYDGHMRYLQQSINSSESQVTKVFQIDV